MKEKKSKLTRTLEIPEEVTVELEGNTFKIKGPKGELVRTLSNPLVSYEVSDSITVSCLNMKKSKRIMNTFISHIQNMIRGVTDGFIYQLKICSGHFPMNVSKEGNKIVIKNFLGEKVPREAKLLEGVEAQIEQDTIEISGSSIELVGQTAANLEQATKIRNRDRRRFQDGIFITSKGGDAS
tara:strand:- start:177 stop:722 length:546 start_codon:yes stop_codon:yes gene_type:complete